MARLVGRRPVETKVSALNSGSIPIYNSDLKSWDTITVSEVTGSVFPYTGSAIISGSLVVSGSTNIVGTTGTTLLSTNADTLIFTGSLYTSGSIISTGSLEVKGGITGSLLGTSSFADTASRAISSSYAETASYANNFTVAGTLTAQTIVAQTITSSTEFITGSTKFGSLLSNTHQFTGSVGITGSLEVNGRNYINDSSSFESRITVNSASFVSFSGSYVAESSSFANRIAVDSASFTVFSGSYVIESGSSANRITINSASFATFSGSYINESSSFASRISTNSASFALFSGSYINESSSFASRITTDSASFVIFSGSYVNESSSFASRITDNSASFASFSGSYVNESSSFASRITTDSASISSLSSSFLSFSSSYNSASFTGSFKGDGGGLYNIPAGGIVGLNLSQIASGSATASISPNNGFVVNTTTTIIGSLNVTNTISGSLQGTASYASNANLLDGKDSSIFATTGSNIFNGDQMITGSLLISGSQILTGSLNVVNGITGSLLGTASYWSGSIVNVESASYAATASNAPDYLPLAGGTMTGDIYAAGRTFTFQDLLLGAGTTFGKITTDGTKYISIMPTYNVESARFWPNGNVTIQDAGTYVDNGFRLDVSGSGRFTDGLTVTGSLQVVDGITGSLLGTASQALTASSADNFTVRGTLTAQTIVAQTITSSTEFITGSTKNGSLLTNTHQFTGSVSITGSLEVNGRNYINDSSSFESRITTNSSSLASRITSDSSSFESRITTNSASFAAFSGSYVNESSSFASRITNNSASIAAFSSSYINESSSFASRITTNSASFASFSGSYINESSSFASRITTNSASFATFSGSYVNESSSFASRITTNSASFASFSGSYINESSSFASRITTNSASISNLSASFREFSGSFMTGSFTGSFKGLLEGTSSYASTASSADNFTVRGTLTAQTIVAQTITSSTEFITGSTKFGSLQTNTHQFTGSVSVTGSLAVNAPLTITNNNSGNGLTFGSQNWQIGSAGANGSTISYNGNVEYVINAGQVGTPIDFRINNTTLMRLTGSSNSVMLQSGGTFINNGYRLQIQPAVSGALWVSGSSLFSGSVISTLGFTGSLLGTASYASQALSASYWSGSILNVTSASYAENANLLDGKDSSVFASTGSNSFSGSQTISSGFKLFTDAVENLTGNTLNLFGDVKFNGNVVDVPNDLAVTGSFVANNMTGSLLGTASYAISASHAVTALSSSYALNSTTSSYALIALSSSYALSASYAPPIDTSYFATTGSNTFIGNQTITGSLLVSGSISTTGNVNITTGNALVTHHIKAEGSNGLEIFANNGALIASMGQGGGTQANFTGSLSSTQFSAPSITGSLLGTASYASNANLLDGKDSSVFASTGSNIFVGNQTISGSLVVSGSTTILNNLTVLGTASYNTVTASSLLVNDNWITVTTTSSLGRFGGIRVLDYESTGDTASFAWDTTEDRWIEIAPQHDTYSSSLFIMGPKNTGSLGSEIGLTPNFIPRTEDEHHLIDSAISDNGTNIILGRNSIITGSLNVTQGVTASLFGTASYAIQSLTASYWSGSIKHAETSSYSFYAESVGGIISGSIVTTGSNNFVGNQTISGSLSVTGNLTVLGTASFTYVTASQIALSASFLSLNVFEPAERFGGIKVYDSGSFAHQATASLAWDSTKNVWIYQNVTGSVNAGGVFIAGPENTGSLGDEQFLIEGRIPKSVGENHIDNSIMSEISGSIGVSGSLVVTGSFGLLQSIYKNQNTSSLTSGTKIISTNSTSSYTSAFYNYVLSSGANARAGQFITVWNGSSINYTDVSTTDIGNTLSVVFTASLSGGNVVLSTVLPSNDWTIKTNVNLL
jgi:hypothetical protein